MRNLNICIAYIRLFDLILFRLLTFASGLRIAPQTRAQTRQGIFAFECVSIVTAVPHHSVNVVRFIVVLNRSKGNANLIVTLVNWNKGNDTINFL